jgi:hypothetical protein
MSAAGKVESERPCAAIEFFCRIVHMKIARYGNATQKTFFVAWFNED